MNSGQNQIMMSINKHRKENKMDYKEKLRLAKEALESGSYDKETIEYIFPELKESEDEKIRKELVQYLKDYPNLPKGNYCRDDFFAWPEKQGEQKPMEYLKFKVGDSIEYNDKQWSVIGIDIENHCYDLTDDECVDFDTAHYSFKLVEQKPAWSEEDEKIKYEIEVILANTDLSKLKLNYTFFNMISWLKSLKDRYTWKPSKEQMKQLGWVAVQNKDNMIGKELMSLYQDLQKLRKE